LGVTISGTRSTLASILWQGNEFVAAGENGTVLVAGRDSLDGAFRAGPRRSQQLLQNAGELAAVGDDVKILTSPDSITWTPRASTTTANLNAVAWNGSRFVAVRRMISAPTSDRTLAI
jgi:hypothetical protein